MNSSITRRFYCLVIILGFISKPAHTEELAFLSDSIFLEEFPVILSASRLSQSRKTAPTSVTVIDQAMIRASGITSLPELFRMVPGFQVGHSDSDLLTPRPTSVTYLGMNDEFSRRMQVLIDGRSVYSPIHGGVRWDSLPIELENIERIEVVRGPNAATYGSNSFSGVINIITRSAVEHKKLYFGTTVSDIKYNKPLLRVSQYDEDFSFQLTLSKKHDDGFETLRDEREYDNINLNFDYYPTLNDTLTFNIGDRSGSTQVGIEPFGALGDGVDRPFRTAETSSNFQQIIWTHQLH